MKRSVKSRWSALIIPIISGLLVAGVVRAAEMYYDFDTSEYVVNEAQRFIGALSIAGNTTLTGDFTANNNFHINSTSGNVGIGTTTPSYGLDVSRGTGIVGRFSGRVIGANAVNNDEFTTLGQVNTAISNAGHAPVTLTGQNYLTLSGQQITANAINISGSHVTGTLPIASGGTGATSYVAGRILFGNGTSALNTSPNLAWNTSDSRLQIGGDIHFDSTTSRVIKVSDVALGSGSALDIIGSSATNSVLGGNGGNINITAGSGMYSSGVGNGGSINITGGTASGSMLSGAVSLSTGGGEIAIGGSTVNSKGAISIKPASGGMSGGGGSVEIISGGGGYAGQSGNVTIGTGVVNFGSFGDILFTQGANTRMLIDSTGRVGVSTILSLADGSSTVPSLSFNDDLDTGMYRSGDNSISFATNGLERLNIDANGALSLNNGFIYGDSSDPFLQLSTSAGALMGYGATDTFFQAGYQNLSLTTAGVKRMTVNADGNVGIGTTTPSNRLTVTGNASVSGRLGIGTTLPGYNLDVMGNGRFFSTGNANFSVYASGANSRSYLSLISSNGASVYKEYRLQNDLGDKFKIYDSSTGNDRLVIDGSGNVGIGTSSPSVKLQVAGDGLFNNSLSVGGYVEAVGGYRFFDTRAVASVPSDFPGRAMSLDFKSRTSVGNPPSQVSAHSSYAHIMTIAGWDTHSGSGGWPMQLSFGGGGIGIRQATNASTWGAWSTTVMANASGNVGIGRTPTTNILEINGNASKSTAGQWLANSDRRIKKEIEEVDGLYLIRQLRPVTFSYTDEYLLTHPEIENRIYYNFIAQEFAMVFPDAVQGSGEYLPDGSEILQLDTQNAFISAISAIKELDLKIADLTTLDTEISGSLFNNLLDWLKDKTLTVLRLKAQRVDTDKLCLGGLCIERSELEQILNDRATPPPVTPSSLVPDNESEGGGGSSAEDPSNPQNDGDEEKVKTNNGSDPMPNGGVPSSSEEATEG